MQEVLPVLIGLILGWVCLPITSIRKRSLAAILLCILGGVLSTTINGEWIAGFVPLLGDVALVAGGVVTVLVARIVARPVGRVLSAFVKP